LGAVKREGMKKGFVERVALLFFANDEERSDD